MTPAVWIALASFGVAVPQAWATYRETLREVVLTGVGPLPDRPDWP